MYFIICKDLNTNLLSHSVELYFEGQVDQVLKHLNGKNNNCIYYKELFSWA